MTSLPVPLSPRDQDRCVGGGHLAGHVDRLAEQGRYADQRVGVTVAVLLLQLLPEIVGFPSHHDCVRGPPDQHL